MERKYRIPFCSIELGRRQEIENKKAEKENRQPKNILDSVKELVLKLINEDSNREGFNIISEIEYKGYWEDCSEETDCDYIKEYITECRFNTDEPEQNIK